MPRLVVLFVVASVFGLAACGSSGGRPATTPTTPASSAPAHPALTMSIETGTDASTSMAYTVLVPKVSGLADASAQDAINSGFARVAHTARDAAIGDVRQAGPCETDCGDGSSYKCESGTQFLDARTVSARWTCSEIIAGGAHGNQVPVVATFDARSGQQVQLPSLFADGSTYLDTLSASARTQLEKNPDYDPTFNPDGSSAKSNNFQNFNLTGSGLQITFSDYQVAPYAAGLITVTIPYSELQVVARPDGLLSGR